MLPSPESLTAALGEIYINDDILMDILVRLPPKSIFRFRCVSKRWNNMFTSNFFLESYDSKNKASGRLLAFIQTGGESMNVLPTDPKVNLNIYTWNELGYFFGSSKGLILCGCKPHYYIVNPVTGRIVRLPPSRSLRAGAKALVCDVNTRELLPSYKVVVADLHKVDNVLTIETYSSRTSKWATSALQVTEDCRLQYNKNPLVVNSIIHWHADHHIVIYDSKEESEYVQLIRLPVPPYYPYIIARASCDDALWLSTNVALCITFWMLPVGENASYKRSTAIPNNEWIKMHTICHASLLGETILKGCLVPKRCSATLESALVPWKPHVVILRVKEKVFLCNIESNSVEVVKYHRTPRGDGHLWNPYVDSLCLSSYAL